MTEKLEGSDWDSITTVIDNIDKTYAYKFINDSTGVPTYVAWWDYFDDPTYNQGDSNLITLTGIFSNQVIITDAVPNDTSEDYITDYNTAFQIDTLNVSDSSISFYLKESPVFVEEIPNSSIEEIIRITPNEFKLNQNYPNPFTQKTVISYSLFGNQDDYTINDLQLTIHDITGRIIKTLVSGKKDAGSYNVSFNAEDLASGIYFYKLKIGDKFSQTKKFLLLK